jgi:hypothetical protein
VGLGAKILGYELGIGCIKQCLEPNRNRTQNPGSFAEPNPNRNPKMLELEPNPNPFLRTGTEPKNPGSLGFQVILKFKAPKYIEFQRKVENRPQLC